MYTVAVVVIPASFAIDRDVVTLLAVIPDRRDRVRPGMDRSRPTAVTAPAGSDVTGLQNPRDEAGRVLCPICTVPIAPEERRLLHAGRFAYHAAWRLGSPPPPVRPRWMGMGRRA